MMETFEIYTLGSGYYLEKIFNAIRMILDPGNNFTNVMKLSALAATVVLTIRAGLNNDFKTAAKWFFGVTILVGLFLTSKANVEIIDTLPDSYGRLSAPRRVDSVPWGLALIGSVTSNIGNNITQKFDQSLAGVFNNPDYQKTGILFGSKIVEDTSKMKIDDAGFKRLMLDFYKKCIVPDLNMGYKRKNGYTVRDLVEAPNILEFLKNNSSKARIIHVPYLLKRPAEGEKKFGNYLSCQQTAEYLYNSLDQAVTSRIPILAQKFSAFFSHNGPAQSSIAASETFKTVLKNSYGIFLQKSSKEAKDILLQNMAINSLSEAAGSKLYGKVATESMTKLAYNSVGQMAQKFIPILRAVLECLFYGVFPLVLILMVTPIGLDILKNYAFGFIYLQLWQPMYAILFCIASSWGKLYASNINDITFATHSQIMHINEEIASISGYMLTLVPVLSLFITKGMVANMGNLASSIIYIPQSTAVQNADSAIKGNYQIGTTSIDTHQSNTLTANKYDDNYNWMSGMKSFSMPSGAQERMHSDGRSTIDSSGAISNAAGLVRIDIAKAVGSRYDQSISDNTAEAKRHASNMVENASSGYNKLLGFDESFSKNSQTYENWNKSLTTDQRKSLDEARNIISKISQNTGVNSQDIIKLGTNAGLQLGIGASVGSSISSSVSATKNKEYAEALQAIKDEKLSEALSKVQSFASSSNIQEGYNINNNTLESSRSDFNKAKLASLEMSKSIDKVHSLQEAKSNFEQSSSGINQDLTNRFIEEKIKEFGPEKFENMVRNNPERIGQLSSEFSAKYVNEKSIALSNEINNEKAESQTRLEDIQTKYQQDQQQIEYQAINNDMKIEKTGSMDLRQETKSHVDAYSDDVKQSVDQENIKSNDKISKKSKSLNNEMDNVDRKVTKKTNRNTMHNLASSLNPLNKE